MKIGCNLSTELMVLIDKQKLSVDYVKVALSKLDEKIPLEYKNYGILLLHGIGVDVPQHTGAANLENLDWDRVRYTIDFFDSKFIGLHCGAYMSDWQEEEITYEMVKERMGYCLKVWKRNLTIDILIENLPYTPYYEKNNSRIIKHSVSPRLINELCIEQEVGLLLDIAHAKVSASGLSIPVKEYLDALPLDRVREVHVVGTRDTVDGLRDSHLEMDKEDYEILEYVIQRSNPEIVTLEYGGFGEHYLWRSNIDAIERQLKRIREIVYKNYK
ncbi:MAG: DUF692 family multinuclear iron-containing protein [Bacillota bacterium]